MTILAIVVCGYLVGSIPFSLIAGRLVGGVDVRTRGSGNLGATNVLRVIGLKAALPAAFGDVFKGTAVVLIVQGLGGDPVTVTLAALSAVVGHCYPVFAGFRGGKGVATSFGSFLPLGPVSVGISVLIFLAVVIATRWVSLASITALALFPLVFTLMGEGLVKVSGAAAVACLVIVKHRSNIKRLLTGTEPKLGQSPEDKGRR